MSFPTVPTFIHHSDWDATSRQHPAMAFMESYTHAFDAGLQSMGSQLSKWHTPDFTYVTATGETIAGVDAAFAKLAETYGPLTAYHHEPFYLACHPAAEKQGDYVMIGLATVYANTPGEPSAAAAGGQQQAKTDGKGRAWEVSLPGAYRFYYRAEEGGAGFRMAKTEIFSDSGPIAALLLKKGVVTLQQLGLAA